MKLPNSAAGSSALNSFLTKLYADSDNTSAALIEYPPPIGTPSPSLNWALNGGVRPGAIYCFEGPEGSGKSFMALCCAAELLKKNSEGVVIWFDVEGSFSEHFVSLLLPNKEDQERLIVRKSSTGASIFDYFRDTILGMIDGGLNVLACVVDSLQTIVPPKESQAKSTEDHIMGDLSSYLPKALRLISHPSKPRLKEGFIGIPWFFISQVRDNLDPSAVYTGKKYSISGGRAFKHAIDVEILFESIEARKAKIFDETLKNMNDTAIQVGHRIRAKILKNRLGPPARIVEFDLIYSKGIVNQESEIAVLAVKLGLITKEGNTYFFNNQKLAVGEDAAVKQIAADPELQRTILTKIMETSNDETLSNNRRSSPRTAQSSDSGEAVSIHT